MKVGFDNARACGAAAPIVALARGAVKALLMVGVALAAQAAPRTPAADTQVLESLPLRAAEPAMQQWRRLREAARAAPAEPGPALALARWHWAQAAATGDPRHVGYAQAALAPWWAQPAPPPAVRVQRAVLQQFNHHFDAARADLQAAVAAEPKQPEAWSWLAAIAMVQARYDDARTACARLAPLASPLVAAACTAAVDSATGRAATAAAALQRALAAAPAAPVAERLWALTRLAETEERLGRAAEAEAAYRAARALGQPDVYLQAAEADFLLDQGRPAEVLALLRGQERSDLLLLRLALAAQALGRPEAATWRQALAERFAAAVARGDTAHQKEQARHELVLAGRPAVALALAQANFAVQREPADARVLLEAAVATRSRTAAQPVLDWMRTSGIESRMLQALAQRLPAP